MTSLGSWLEGPSNSKHARNVSNSLGASSSVFEVNMEDGKQVQEEKQEIQNVVLKQQGKRSLSSGQHTSSKEVLTQQICKGDQLSQEGQQEEDGIVQEEQQDSGPPHKKVRLKGPGEVEEDSMRDQEEIIRPDVPQRCSSRDLRVVDRTSGPYMGSAEDGHMKYIRGLNISQRFKIMEKMGAGTFGQVFECWDRIDQVLVAVKVIRNIRKYRDAAMTELKVLETIKQNDRTGKWHCVTLKGWFERQGHVCMVFHRLGPSIFDYLQRNGYKGFPLYLIRSFTKQLLEAVAYMHELTLIHTDLKPENILLVNDNYSKEEREEGSRIGKRVPDLDKVRVIDFGSATFESDNHSTVVQTRHYRAPEVILGLGWSYPCDIWSVGCILYELIVGDTLFQTRENLEHLAMMERVLGRIPEFMIRNCNDSARKYFTRHNSLDWPQSKKSASNVRKLRSLRDLIRDRGDRSFEPFLDVLCDLIIRMLQYDPENRITAKEALKHQFFDHDYSSRKEITRRVRNGMYVDTDLQQDKLAENQTPQSQVQVQISQTLIETPRDLNVSNKVEEQLQDLVQQEDSLQDKENQTGTHEDDVKNSQKQQVLVQESGLQGDNAMEQDLQKVQDEQGHIVQRGDEMVTVDEGGEKLMKGEEES
eukprot:TRINITY_DN1229_c0_g1_i1.p1 TRINITY_DN1229_c0_g1~~TRINITY_DN1229_c0_g1_i1.p1  ORF type:complete len:644 (-),score=78.67 TRINITY_DN1229_c0_g1_i1:492-2423(-)